MDSVRLNRIERLFIVFCIYSFLNYNHHLEVISFHFWITYMDEEAKAK